jgi:signal transduction histidine kinase
VATSSADAPIFASAVRLIFCLPEISRTADDMPRPTLYLQGVQLRFSLRRIPRLDPVAFDCILAVALVLVAELQIWVGGGAGRFEVVAASVAPPLAACVAVRRLYPTLAGVAAQGVMTLTFGVWGDTQIFGSSVAWFCALYALTVWSSPRRFVAGAVFVLASNIAAAAGPVATMQRSGLFGVVTLVVMLIIRRVLGDRERRVELAQRERDVAAREAVVEERARIARELHDAIAHNVSMMVVQAGAERRVLEPSNDATRDVLETIEKIGRGALTEMRRMVGMLRSDVPGPLAPQPGLDDLATLVGQVREAGLPVELRVEGERRALPVGIELSAYRIVQEALTNALKHAGGAHAIVNVRYGAESLELEIVDDGPGVSAPVSGGGHGLVGMRERVALYGGRLDAGRRASGGFAVRVLLPIR